MRKVKFKNWIPVYYKSGTKEKIKGSGEWTDFVYDGLFHCWGVEYEEFEAGPGNYSVALVELPNGEIKTVLPSNLKFID